jgi:diguanylate cyclase (GGDEF)-like protein
MTSEQDQALGRADEPDSLALAINQTHDVTEKLGLCADNLGSSNDVAKVRQAAGANPLSADKSLANNQRVQRELQECAHDLHHLSATLMDGIGEVREQTRMALAESQSALASSEAALASARDGEKKAQLRVLRDFATGLANRGLFDDRLTHAIALAKRHDWTLAIMFLGIASFNYIDETHGRIVGDRVLQEIGKRLLKRAREEDTICRNDGGEFLYLLMNPRGSENILRIAGALLQSVTEPIDTGDDRQHVIKASIGIASYPEDGITGQQLIQKANTAMYRARNSLSGCVFFKALEPNEALEPKRYSVSAPGPQS